jgi:PadR family transcriptional regulator PadR
MSSDGSPLGVFEEQILVAVLRTGDEAYGMQVRREIERVTGRELAIGAVYATLDRLEEKGLVSSRRVIAESPTRRVFALSRQGAAALQETRAMRDRLWAGIDLRRLTGLARVPG